MRYISHKIFKRIIILLNFFKILLLRTKNYQKLYLIFHQQYDVVFQKLYILGMIIMFKIIRNKWADTFNRRERDYPVRRISL